MTLTSKTSFLLLRLDRVKGVIDGWPKQGHKDNRIHEVIAMHIRVLTVDTPNPDTPRTYLNDNGSILYIVYTLVKSNTLVRGLPKKA
jgi:hypothetical protein